MIMNAHIYIVAYLHLDHYAYVNRSTRALGFYHIFTSSCRSINIYNIIQDMNGQNDEYVQYLLTRNFSKHVSDKLSEA